MRLRMPIEDFMALMEGHSGKTTGGTRKIREKYGLSRADVCIMRKKIRRKKAKVVLV